MAKKARTVGASAGRGAGKGPPKPKKKSSGKAASRTPAKGGGKAAKGGGKASINRKTGKTNSVARKRGLVGKAVAAGKSGGRSGTGGSGGEEGSGAVKVKTHLSRKELTYYRKLLLIKRAELSGDMASMSEEALNTESTDLSHVPLHMADMGSENHDRELMLGLAESERKTVRQIDEALVRIAEGTYGVCEATGRKITKARLEAKPWARYCIEVAREQERRGGG